MSERSRTPRLIAVGRTRAAAVQLPVPRGVRRRRAGARDPPALGVPVHGLGSRRSPCWRGSCGTPDDAGDLVIVVASVAYLGLLFAIAYYGDRRADRAAASSATATSTPSRWPSTPPPGPSTAASAGRRPPASASCRSTSGPTVMVALWWLRAAQDHPDQQAATASPRWPTSSPSRYGKSTLLGGLVTVIAVVGIVPYISLQLKAISNTFESCAGSRATLAVERPRRPAPAGHRALRGAAAGRVHDPLRHPPPGRHRAARGHGRRHRLRVRGQARRVPRGRLLS